VLVPQVPLPALSVLTIVKKFTGSHHVAKHFA
jgi:hypothetical protein